MLVHLVNFLEYVDSESTFSVRISRLFGSSEHINKMHLERKLGRIIELILPLGKVDLKHPDNRFVGISNIDHFFFGLKK